MHIFLETDEQLERLLKNYGCKDLEELSRIFYKTMGYEIVDRRDSSEYTNVNAQRDPDFMNEF